MSVRSRLAERPAEIAKVFGPGVPASFRQGEEQSQMTPASPFSPGQPIGPYDGYDRTPRAHDFVTGYNIATRPRVHERVSFETLKGLIGAYDVADTCIWHRIDSIRSLKWKLLAADHYYGDVTGAVPLGLAALKKPDRKQFFKTWLAKYAYDILAYDAGTLYRMRNRGGKCVGLKVVDGTTIAPLLDYWGDPPEPPAESHVQFVNGLPWNWLTADDLIYEPYRPHSDSPYGHAPIESIILTANTDLRFQVYFLQRFTEGNLPAAFASAPETWSPDQIEQFQAYWDSFMYGDQGRKHQIRWMPGGSKFAWSNEKDFSDHFSLFLMRKTCAAYSVVPSDLGFTENVNRSSGESQADVQHRVGDLPFMEHVEGILSAFLYDDLGLPLKFEFDRGEEQVDQAAQAEADQKYMDRAVVSASEIREMRYGLTDAKPVPRVFFTERSGPIPLSSLEAVAGEVDPQTAAPVPGAALPHQVFEDAPGVVPQPPLYSQPLAEEIYGPKAIPPHTETASTMPVAKEGEGAPVPGITSETGIYGDPLIRDDNDEDEAREAAVKSELSAFRRFERGRRRAGEWRDFRFAAIGPVQAHNLNDAGRLAVRKAAGEVAVAGLAVLAADTGRVLMLQRALCDDDPAAGKLEFPGGHLEQDESPLQAAWREWAEETGAVPPPGVQTGSWISPNGIYQGIVWTTEREASVPVRGEAFVPNPDDPDGDAVEAILWFDPADLPGNSAVRAELLENIDAVMAALGRAPGCCGADCCQDGSCCNGAGGCTCGAPAGPSAGGEEQVIKAYPDGQSYGSHAFRLDGGTPDVCCWYCGMARIDPFHCDYPDEVAKAGEAPKVDAGSWPGWDRDLAAAGYWAALLTAALTGAIGKGRAERMARAWIAAHPDGPQDGQGRRFTVEAAAAWVTGWLASQQIDLAGTCQQLVPGITADGWLIGGASAASLADGTAPDWGGWQPGDQDAARARMEALGITAGPFAVLGAGSDAVAQEMASGFITRMARALVDGLAEGTGAVALGAAVFAALSDEGFANGSVLVQLLVAAGAAAMAVYLARDVRQVDFVTADDARVCPRCEECAAGSPYAIADAPATPQHDRCRCARVPVRR